MAQSPVYQCYIILQFSALLIMDEQNSKTHSRTSSPDRINQYLKEILEPPNPILSKQIDKYDEKVNFKFELKQEPRNESEFRKSPTRQIVDQYEDDKKKEIILVKRLDKMNLNNGYQIQTMLFLKHDNKKCNKRCRTEYFSSMFLGLESGRNTKLAEYKGMVFEDDLVFDSNYQSANLMAVFKVGPNVYDLVLQNDVNTKGFTQWFNFKVQNKKTNFIAKFNIVNLYKKKSLYNIGMKPIVRSERSDKSNKRIWRRRGFNIFYEKNELNYEDDQTKFYKTLSFQYDFTTENDIVQFAHCMPYDLTDLKKLLESIKVYPRVSLITLGNTIMGRSIPVIKISSVDNSNPILKKALIIMARQHPGETPGSFLVEEMILSLMKNGNEIDFLIWRFDIYIIPMVNIDGVVLGNYRSNFAGFDLNRCWLKPDPQKQPEVNLIKNYIKKIAKKQQIELILDLHGHSRKLGSFFYGNDFGSNHFLFPYIASKANRNILFQKSKFTHQTEHDSKFSTARVVLGNLIKDTGGYVYTYQVSFFGYYKENTEIPFSFTEQHYKELGKSLVQSIYRTFLEIYKEQKTLKESLFMKTIKGELTELKANSIEDKDDSQQGSDSQAQQQMIKQTVEIDLFLQKSSLEYQEWIEKTKREEQTANNSMKEKQIDLGMPVQRYNKQIKRKIQELLQKNLQNDLKNVIIQRLPKLSQKNIKKHIKSQKLSGLDDSNCESTELIKNDSQKSSATLGSRIPQLSYIDYLKLKKQQKNTEQALKIYGATVGIQGKALKGTLTTQSSKPISESLEQRKREISSKEDILKFFVVRHASPPERSKQMRSQQTIDVKQYSILNKNQKELIDPKPYFHRRKMKTPNFSLQKSKQSECNISNKSINLDVVAQSMLKMHKQIFDNRFATNSQNIPQVSLQYEKKQWRVKLPQI